MFYYLIFQALILLSAPLWHTLVLTPVAFILLNLQQLPFIQARVAFCDEHFTFL
jgi:hypothetical protein